MEGTPNVTNWDAEDGYINNNDSESDRGYLKGYPSRIFGAGHRAGLTASIRLYEKDFDVGFRCNPILGFKVLLHNPVDVPQFSEKFFLMPLNHEMLVAIKPNMISTSEGLRDYDPNRRGCYFKGERQLRFFTIYSQKNCEIECVSNFTEGICGCVKFSFPSNKVIKAIL